ncbi:MAG TPA: hypothetical protein VKQ28_05215 [Candidatus Acidoferrum sp.]|nr:hypothetical protein [Candidatus Acidoferrum sp.]
MRFAVTAGIALLAGAGVCAEPPKVKCTAERQEFVVFDAKTKTEKGYENWHVTCAIKKGGQEVYSGPLVLPYPATFRDAMDAIEEFRSKKAPEILKGKK